MKNLTAEVAVSIKEDVVTEPPAVTPEVISDYQKLNIKQDAVMSKINGRKKNKKSPKAK